VNDEDPHSATDVIDRELPGLAGLPRGARKYITPKAFWITIVSLALSIGYVGRQVYKIDQHQESITEMQKSIAKLVEQSQDTRNDVTSIKATVGDMKEDQRERWERIDKVVAEPTHARRKR
jgi:peptidoglycan hydrolase CwlO-like protein